MAALYLASVWAHILAATIWVGGLFFIVLVVAPWLRHGGPEQRAIAARFLTEAGGRFRTVGWVCFGVLLTTGTYNLHVRGIGPDQLGDARWWASDPGRAIGLKLFVFALVVVLSLVHDFRVGPRATEAMRDAPGAGATARLRRTAALLGRVNGVLALVLVALGVVIVRGWPM